MTKKETTMTEEPESVGPPPWRALPNSWTTPFGGTLKGDDARGAGNGDAVEVHHLSGNRGVRGGPDPEVAQQLAERLFARRVLAPGDDESRRKAREAAAAAEAARPRRSKEELLARRRRAALVMEGAMDGVVNEFDAQLLTVPEHDIEQFA
jgi:hypothetical protein